MKVYEVELPAPAPGQRFCQHVKAFNPDDARAKVQARWPKLRVGEVTVRRDCTQAEIAAEMSVRTSWLQKWLSKLRIE